ncbi:unnamed protein product [Gongylonema pulchrum]|uniref:Heat shock 70 kDa protein 14 n=1 Tax=Gongylonema pulchrum TaxID=637853 RepID=A0A183DVU7_9BILA|nr:unnamed protein product [Gongylonema pulchrum]
MIDNLGFFFCFRPNGTLLVGLRAVEQQEHNPLGTIYDAKRFIGKKFSADDPEFQDDKKRYPFKIDLDDEGSVYFTVPLESGKVKKIRPEEVGAIIIDYLRKAAEKKYRTKFKQGVISVPADFDDAQHCLFIKRDYFGIFSGIECRRVISEPTAAALAYGLHKKKGVQYIIVVDLGGGTLDVSILWLQGVMFMTIAMAGNNRLGGQDFNDRVQHHLMEFIRKNRGKALGDKGDIQQLRLAIEAAKIQLTTFPVTNIDSNLQSLGKFHYRVVILQFFLLTELTREEFEALNEDLLESVTEPIEAALNDAEITASDIDEIVLVGGSTRIPRVRSVLTREEFEALNEDLLESVTEPIEAALNDAEITASDIDEIVLVGGSTRIPRVRSVVGSYFGKAPNHGVNPELAVVTGAAVQAGVIGGGWPLQVCVFLLSKMKLTKVVLKCELP